MRRGRTSKREADESSLEGLNDGSLIDNLDLEVMDRGATSLTENGGVATSRRKSIGFDTLWKWPIIQVPASSCT